MRLPIQRPWCSRYLAGMTACVLGLSCAQPARPSTPSMTFATTWDLRHHSTVPNAAAPLVHSVRVGSGAGPLALDERTGHAFVLARESTDNSNIIVGLGDRGVWMVDTITGRVLTSTTMNTNPVALDIYSATERVFVASQPYLPTSTTAAYPANRSRVTTLTAVTEDDQTGHAFAATWRGTLAVLDARSGRVLRVVTLPTYAASLAVDSRRDHVLVVGNGVLSVLDKARL